MNLLFVGTHDKHERIKQVVKPDFLLIADDTSVFEKHFKTARVFDPTIHSFNPLEGIDYKKARDIAAILYAAYPQGENTLTVRNGRRALTKALVNTTRLDRLIGDEETSALRDDILLSPIVRNVLCGKKPFSFKGSIIARINRAELGDFDSFILANLLIGQFQGQVIVLDGGFYLRPLHVSLIRQNRLIAGVNYLEELEPKLRQAVLLIKDKQGAGCTYEDAVVLASYAGLAPTHNNYIEFVQGAMD